MNELAKNLWAFFFACLLFGIWTIPIIAVLVGINVFLRLKWPGRFDKYL